MTPPPLHPDAMPPICHRCGALLSRGDGSFYIVRIEAFADPTPPGEDILDTDGPSFDELIDQMRGQSERELLDQVHRRLELLLCRACYAGWIEQPTG